MAIPYRQQLKQKGPGFKPFLLYILPLPLLLVAVSSFLTGRFFQLVYSSAALLLVWLAARFIQKAAQYQWQAEKRSWARATRVPWRLSAAVFCAVAAFLITTMVIGHNLFIGIAGAVAAFAGVVLTYGLDPQYDDKANVSRFGVTTEEVLEALDEAEVNLAQIETAGKQIGNQELKTRLSSIVEKTRGVLALIEQDPKDLRRARKFLKVYLTGARNVTTQYAATHRHQENAVLETNFRNVLTSIEDVITEQHQKLLENDALDLDVKIEVLEAQLKHEGII